MMYSSNQPKHVSCCKSWQRNRSRDQKVVPAVPTSRRRAAARLHDEHEQNNWPMSPLQLQIRPLARERHCIRWVTHHRGQTSRSCLCAGPSGQERHLDTQEWDAPTHGGCSQYFGSPVSPAASWGQALPAHQRPVAGCTAFPRGPIPVTAVSEDTLKQTASRLVPRLEKRKSKDDFKHPTVWIKEDVRFHFNIFHEQNIAEKLLYNMAHILYLVIDGYHNFCSWVRKISTSPHNKTLSWESQSQNILYKVILRSFWSYWLIVKLKWENLTVIQETIVNKTGITFPNF